MSNVIQFPRRPRREPTFEELEFELFRAVNGYDGQHCNLDRINFLRDALLRHWIGGPQPDEGNGGSAA